MAARFGLNLSSFLSASLVAEKTVLVACMMPISRQLLLHVLLMALVCAHLRRFKAHVPRVPDVAMIWTDDTCVPEAVTVSCGNPNNNNCLDDYCSPATELHEVRCCSDEQIDNYQQRNGCEVWAESQFLSVGEPGGGEDGPGCVHDADLSTAFDTCAADGARLCTLEEIQGSCTQGTGCGHDADMIWTDDACSGEGETGCAPV